MKKIPVIIEWASDGGIAAYMKENMFAGQGDTVDAAVEDMRGGVKLFVETAKKMGFPYKEYLDGEYEVEPDYDVQSMLEHATKYMTLAGLEKLTGIKSTQIRRYAHGEAKPRPAQKRKILEGIKEFSQAFAAITL